MWPKKSFSFTHFTNVDINYKNLYTTDWNIWNNNFDMFRRYFRYKFMGTPTPTPISEILIMAYLILHISCVVFEILFASFD